VAFFATGDSIVSNNLVLNLYSHINSPEARMFLSRQLYEEALHVQFYLTLLDNYIPDMKEREAAFAAVENIPSIKAKADFCFKWMDQIQEIERIETPEHRKQFLLNLICFATCIEGLFFFAAFAYVYFLRSKGLLNGLADGTNWVFRDESCHMNFALEVVNTVRAEEPELFDAQLESDIREMISEAVECEYLFAADVLVDRPRVLDRVFVHVKELRVSHRPERQVEARIENIALSSDRRGSRFARCLEGVVVVRCDWVNECHQLHASQDSGFSRLHESASSSVKDFV
jgi:ribonucleotide reductase beta subunit family protein with ferritin-like domain